MRAFFEANLIEVLLVYGLSFIVLGVVIFVLPRQDARLRFISHLPLLAAFGLIHGLLEFIILWKTLYRPDGTRRKQAEEEIRQLALYDPLTRLPNRRLLQDRLTPAFNASMRTRNFGARRRRRIRPDPG